MAKYVSFFTYTSDAWARMIQSPGDRTAAIRQVAESLGGSVECVYWMFGTYDGMVIIDVPDSISAAAMSVTAGSAGAFKTMETHELLTQEQLSQVLSRSRMRRRLTSHRASKEHDWCELALACLSRPACGTLDPATTGRPDPE